MTSDEFLERFDDMSARFLGWWYLSPGLVVVTCKVFDTSTREGAWLACASTERRAATRILRSFGAHGFKFSQGRHQDTADSLIRAAAASKGSIVALLPDGELSVFPEGFPSTGGPVVG